MNNLTKRILTSIILIFILILCFYHNFILIISLIIASLIAWIEFNGLISKIFIGETYRIKLLKLSSRILTLMYLFIFSGLVFWSIAHENSNYNIYIAYLFLICIFSDVGGLIFGKTFKGKKLTKISPNKTVMGSFGSFTFSLMLTPFFYYFFYIENFNIYKLIIFSLIVSLICQLGDLFISYLKRMAMVKDTGDILPGHGGILDRIDGMLFAIPTGIFILEIFIFI